MKFKPSRRELIKSILYGTGVVISSGVVSSLSGCSGEGFIEADFNHGVASGDPLSDRVILWTRVTPKEPTEEVIKVFWVMSKYEDFHELVRAGSTLVSSEDDYTLKVDAIGLEPNQKYYYRFSTINEKSQVGTTKTLPTGDISQVRLLAMSCATYPAGYFHVYAEAAKQKDIDAALHLGDYIYEHERGGYASENAEELGRLVLPEGELITLEDYRTRYAQYRTDSNLQNFHAALPVIAVWDDHEIANDAWKNGAENHNEESEGTYSDRVIAALKAYSEWMPIRPNVSNDIASLYRNFEFGDLVNLIMLDTRLVGRDLQLEIAEYVQTDGSFDNDRYTGEISNPNRSVLGENQLAWLKNQLSIPSKWSVLGQQVLMGEMKLPGAIATLQLSVSEFSELATAAHIAGSDPDSLTESQKSLLEEKGHLLTLPELPYNLGAWDGYPVERQAILNDSVMNDTNLVVLAGDTHNAWASNLKTNSGEIAGVEFATASVTSPGIEAFFGLDSPEKMIATEQGVLQLIKNLKYTNIGDRGFLSITFSHEKVIADWIFVSDIQNTEYHVQNDRNKQITVSIDRIEVD